MSHLYAFDAWGIGTTCFSPTEVGAGGGGESSKTVFCDANKAPFPCLVLQVKPDTRRGRAGILVMLRKNSVTA